MRAISDRLLVTYLLSPAEIASIGDERKSGTSDVNLKKIINFINK